MKRKKENTVNINFDNPMDFEWWNETLPFVYKNRVLYKIICFFMGRKLTYKEFYLFLLKMNDPKMENKEIKEVCLLKTVDAYKYVNNKIPEEIQELNEGK